MSGDGLTPGQIEVAQVFFDLAESEGFVVAGGAALLALGLSTRPTRDLDVFTAPPASSVREAFNAFCALATQRQWTVIEITAEETFCRFVVELSSEQVLVDLAIDSVRSEPATITVLGPTMAAEELAARKLLALFDRAEARDFVDVYHLVQQFDRNVMVQRAAAVDLGFDLRVLALAMRSHARFDDSEFIEGPDDLDQMRSLFAQWADALESEALPEADR